MTGKNYDFWKVQLTRRTILCQQCVKENASTIHHHDLRDDNDEEANLILLCQSCYKYLHKKKSTTKKFLLNEQQQHIIEARRQLEWITKKRYYKKHKTLRTRIDKALSLLTR